jgi:hypothetical protein
MALNLFDQDYFDGALPRLANRHAVCISTSVTVDKDRTPTNFGRHIAASTCSECG